MAALDKVTDGMEVINMKDQDPNQPFEIRLTNGNKVLVHEETAYDDHFPSGRSFEDAAGEGKNFQFQYDFKVHKDGLKEMKSLGNTIRSNPMAVYHNYVMWTYAAELTLVDDKDDMKFSFTILSVGPCFNKKSVTMKGGVGTNCPEKQMAPTVLDAKLVLVAPAFQKEVALTSEFDGFVSKKPLGGSLLKKALGDEATLKLRLSLQIGKDYFNLDTILDRKVTATKANSATQTILASILRGEKPPQHDWVITVGEGSPREFFVHRKVLADASPLLETIFRTHTSLNSELLMVSHENRFILPNCRAEDMETILTHMYLRTFPRPRFDAFARVGRTLSALLPPHTILSFFAEWEKLIVNDVVKLERSDYLKTIPACSRQLISIFTMPYGATPVAKRCAIAVMADSFHIGETKGVDMATAFENEESMKFGIMEKIVYSMNKFKTVVAGVEKSVV